MPREASQIILRPVVSEIVQEQKGVEAFGITEPERTLRPYPRTLNRGLGSYEIVDRTDRHFRHSPPRWCKNTHVVKRYPATM
jgi:hypothetical protein